MMCSFHDKEHKKRKLRYKSNFPIKEKMISGKKINEKEGFVKAEQLYYFNKKEIEYKVIAHLDPELLDELVKLILLLGEEGKLNTILTNLKEEIYN